MLIANIQTKNPDVITEKTFPSTYSLRFVLGNAAFKNSYTPKLYEVSIRKQDILNNEDIEGASLQIQNKDTGEIISIDSSKDGQKVNLGYGNYILTEIT